MIVLDSKQIRDIGCALALILVLGLLLLILGKPVSEGFTDAMRCDVDNPCSGHLKCLNGFCAKTDPRPIREKDPVTLLPPGAPAPYF
jgi:hypothetical protein